VRVHHVHVALCFLGLPSQLRVLETGMKRPLPRIGWGASSVFYFRSNNLNSCPRVCSVEFILYSPLIPLNHEDPTAAEFSAAGSIVP